MTRGRLGAIIGVCLVVLTITWVVGSRALQQAGGTISIDNDDIGGVVTSVNGPEAGVWVIAETRDLPTTFARIVVTDAQGRYLLPDLPQGNFDLWVRGYGLVDSRKVQSSPGRIQNLTAMVAPNARAAAEYYPSNYWAALLEMPDESEFPGTGPDGNGIAEGVGTRAQWMHHTKTGGCQVCHQIGSKATREIPESLGQFESSAAAWDRRIQSGQNGFNMVRQAERFGYRRLMEMYGDWTDRIEAGELPPAPPRPEGIERNVVVSLWDWAGPMEYFHDVSVTDKWNPTVNANGPVYGVHENANDKMTILDPVRHTVTQVDVPVLDRDNPPPFSLDQRVLQPSPYNQSEITFSSHTTGHSLMMGSDGRVWVASAVRGPDTAAFCREGSDHPSAKFFPIERSTRHLSVYDPNSEEFTPIDLCFGTHHVQFARDDDHTLWFSGSRNVVGWFNTNMYDQTGDVERSQGWIPFILDTNGNGMQDEFVEPNQAIDPAKDKRVAGGYYGVVANPVDGSIWGSENGFPGRLIRVVPGSNPPNTSLTEIYLPPWDDPTVAVRGYSPRGIDVDTNGVIWTNLQSSHLASFDRSKCRGPLNGPTAATGKHCPEGWTLYPMPGPNYKGVSEFGNSDPTYYNWVDQAGVLGMGRNVPVLLGNGSDSLQALDTGTGTLAVFRVPYPMNFYAKGLDGRLDDPNGGWKGGGIWSLYSNRAPWHIEGPTGVTSKAVKFQVRPDPLAK